MLCWWLCDSLYTVQTYFHIFLGEKRKIVGTKSRQTLKSHFNNMNWSLFFRLIKFAWTGYSLKAERSSEIWIFPGVSSASERSLLTMNCSHVTHRVYIFHRCKTRILHTCGNLAGIKVAGDEPVTVRVQGKWGVGSICELNCKRISWSLSVEEGNTSLCSIFRKPSSEQMHNWYNPTLW